MWTDGNGFFYEGDCRLGDRAATESEIADYLRGKGNVVVWDDIRAERDRRTEQGGCRVAGRWFDADTKSAVRYKYMADAAALAGAADNTVLRAAWRPMDFDTLGPVDMTYGLLKQIMAAGIAQALAIDDAAQVHRAALAACADPSTYDFSDGWPPIFGE